MTKQQMQAQALRKKGKKSSTGSAPIGGASGSAAVGGAGG